MAGPSGNAPRGYADASRTETHGETCSVGAEGFTLGKSTYEHLNHGERRCNPCRVRGEVHWE